MKKKGGFYSVRIGRAPGVYTSWEECEKHVSHFSGAEFKKFKSKEEAENFVNLKNQNSNCSSSSPTIEDAKYAEKATFTDKQKSNDNSGQSSTQDKLPSVSSSIREIEVLIEVFKCGEEWLWHASFIICEITNKEWTMQSIREDETAAGFTAVLRALEACPDKEARLRFNSRRESRNLAKYQNVLMYDKPEILGKHEDLYQKCKQEMRKYSDMPKFDWNDPMKRMNQQRKINFFNL